MAIGERIRELRWDARLKQVELARRAGIAKNTMSQIELGHEMPSVQTLEKIARGLGVEVAELLKEPAFAEEEPGKAFAPPETGRHIPVEVHSSVAVSDQVEAAKYRLAQVRQIMAAWGAGELDDVAADRALEEVYAA